MEKTQRLSLMPLFLVVFLDLLGITLIIPLLAALFISPASSLLPEATSFSLRAILLGLLLAAYPMAQFFGAPLLGAWADHHGRKKLLLISLVGTFIGFVLFAIGIITRNLPLLFVSRIIDGFTGGNISIVNAMIADVSDPKEKAKNFGMIGMAFGLGFIIGPFLGGILSDPSIVSWFSFATPFWVAAGLSLVNIFMVTVRIKETLRTRIPSKVTVFTGFKNIAKAFRMRNLRTIFIVVFLLTLGFNFYTQFFQVYLIEKFNYTQTQIGYLFGYMGLWIALTQGGLTRVISKRVAPAQVLRYSLIALAIVFPLLLLPAKSWWLYLILPFIAIFWGLTSPNSTALVSDQAGPESQGEIMGIQQSMQSLALAIPPVIAGFVVSVHLYLPILFAGGSMLLAWLVFIAFFNPRKSDHFKEL